MGRLQSGQMQRTVNPSSTTSMVRIHLCPPLPQLKYQLGFLLGEKMYKFTYSKDNETYSSSRGRYAKLIFGENNLDNFLQISETDDYFCFTIMQREGSLQGEHCLSITDDLPLYHPLINFMDGFEYIEIMEEGSPERKSIGFKISENNIKVIFNLTNQEKVFQSIELANLRRLGDTRFAKLIPSNKLNEKDFYEMESTFRHKVKVRLHTMMDELEAAYNSELPPDENE